MKKQVLYFAAVLVFIVSSCNNYEYGPSISLRSKTSRLSNEWLIEEGYKNGVLLTDSLPEFQITFKKDGKVTKATIETNGTNIDTLDIKTGLWEFDREAKNVLLLFANNSGVQEARIWRILKLTNSEFWFEERDSTALLEYHLMEKP